MTVYGRLSRLTRNPAPRQYPPSVAPEVALMRDPELDRRYCFFGKHFSLDKERFDGDRGCSLHPVPRTRPSTRKGREAKTERAA